MSSVADTAWLPEKRLTAHQRDRQTIELFVPSSFLSASGLLQSRVNVKNVFPDNIFSIMPSHLKPAIVNLNESHVLIKDCN